MSGRLDKSLDEIITSQRGSGRGRTRRTTRRTGPAGKTATVAPVGGIKKNAKSARGPVKSIPTGPSGNGEGRILVSGFVSMLLHYRDKLVLISCQPKDINEPMIKVCYR